VPESGSFSMNFFGLVLFKIRKMYLQKYIQKKNGYLNARVLKFHCQKQITASIRLDDAIHLFSSQKAGENLKENNLFKKFV
jgi:hypothetical protein